MTILDLFHCIERKHLFENHSSFFSSFFSFIISFFLPFCRLIFFIYFHQFSFVLSYSFLYFSLFPPFIFLVTVNNAGFGFFGPLEAMSMEKAKNMFDTNYFGTVRLIRAALPIMKKQKSGRIVNISSILGHLGECE